MKSIDDLERELDRTRRRGYGLTVEEVEPGTAAIAMAIEIGRGRRSPGTVSVVGPIIRMSPMALEEIAPKLSAAVQKVGELWPIIDMQGAIVNN